MHVPAENSFVAESAPQDDNDLGDGLSWIQWLGDQEIRR
jgi:hypothetical protein